MTTSPGRTLRSPRQPRESRVSSSDELAQAAEFNRTDTRERWMRGELLEGPT